MSEALASYLADGLIGGTTLAVVAALLCAVPAVRARASVVFAIWAVVIARFLIPGLVPIDLPLSTLAAPAPAAPVDAALASAPAGSGAAIDWQRWLQLAWLVGAALIAASSLVGWARLRRRIASLPAAPGAVVARARALAGRLGVRRTIAIVVDRQRGPYAVGVLSPVVAIGATEGPELDDILAHEIAHHRRLDPLWAVIARVARVVFFFWPPVWIAGRRLAAARERATDQLAVARGGREARRYARTLVRETLRARGVDALAMAGDGSQLRARIDDLVAGAAPGAGKLGVILVIAVIALGLPAARFAAAAPASGPIECTVTPGLGARILASHPDADRDGDGVLSRDEICEHQRRMQARLVDAAVRAEVLVEGDAVEFSPAAVTALAGIAELDVEIADGGGAVCTEVETANRCVEQMVLIDVSAD